VAAFRVDVGSSYVALPKSCFSVETFAVSLGSTAYLILLATVIHPALAPIVALVFELCAGINHSQRQRFPIEG
jgi:hypothetical protein